VGAFLGSKLYIKPQRVGGSMSSQPRSTAISSSCSPGIGSRREAKQVPRPVSVDPELLTIVIELDEAFKANRDLLLVMRIERDGTSRHAKPPRHAGVGATPDARRRHRAQPGAILAAEGSHAKNLHRSTRSERGAEKKRTERCQKTACPAH
jgi:hypothetical protein